MRSKKALSLADKAFLYPVKMFSINNQAFLREISTFYIKQLRHLLFEQDEIFYEQPRFYE